MTYRVELTCANCQKEFTCDWYFESEVTCSHCGALLNVEHDTNADDDITGPWVAGIIKIPDVKEPQNGDKNCEKTN